MAKKDVFAVIEQTKEFIYSSSPENRLNESERELYEIVLQQKLLANVTSEEVAEIKSLVENNPKYTFCRGEEKDFLEFIGDFIKEYGSKTDDQANCIMCYIIYNSMESLDINELLKCLDKKQKFRENYFIDFIRELIFKKISFEELEKGLEGENLKIVNKYYVAYALVRGIPYDEMLKRYLAYADKLIEQSTNNKEELEKQNNDILMAVLLDAISAVTSRLVVKRLDSEGKRRIVASFSIVISRIDLNIKLDYRDGRKVILRDLVAYTLLIGCANSIEGFDELTKEFLKSNEQATYSGDYVDVNIVELSAVCGDIDRIREFVARDDVNLCDDTKYKLLGMYGKYPENFGRPHDYITSIVPNDNFAHEDLLELLLNDKVKMLDIHVIYNAMVGKYLTQEEIETLMVHIGENKKVLVYDYINGEVTIVMDPIKRLEELKDARK